MVGVGVLTYIIVFNLNHIVIIGKKRYEYIKMSTIKKMREEKSDFWEKTGELFRQYEPKGNSETAKPSEWWILAYQVRRLMGLISLRKKKQRKHEDEGETKAYVSRSRWYDGLLRRRGERKVGDHTQNINQA
jgi:hypothetical protein